jgi:hypothetical protein
VNKLKKALALLGYLEQKVKKDKYGEVPEKLEDDLEYVINIIEANYPKFPYFMESVEVEGIINEKIDTQQEEVAKDWMEMEAGLRYHNEWDMAETINEFEEFLIKSLAGKAVDEMYKQSRPVFEKFVRDELRKKSRFSNITKLYEKVKDEKEVI